MIDALSGLSGLTRQNLRQQAVSALRKSISAGEIPAGTRVRETELAERFGISRGTLREAFRQLQQEGLIEGGSNGRLSVRHLDNDEIIGIFQVRSSLEELAAGLVCALEDRATALDALQAALSKMTGGVDLELEERIEIDLEFHRTLVRGSCNSALLHSWELLEGAIRMSIMFAGRERALRNMAWDRHSALVEAIATGDEVRARASVRAHMEEATANLVT